MKALTLATTILSLAAHAAAQHASDMIVKLEAGRLITGRVESGIIVYGPRLVSATFGDTGIPGATFNPGFDSETGALPPGQTVGLTIRRALQVWNGQDFVPIPQPPTPPPRLNIIKNNTTITTPIADPANCGVGSNIILGLVNSAGKIHEHPAYQLIDPADGVYLLEIELWMATPSNAVSDPAYIVFNQNSAAITEAFAWADNRFGRAACYPNCDDSTLTPVLSANDFLCFLNRYAAASCDANCDGSTSAPVLTANDFQCFLNRYAAGCS